MILDRQNTVSQAQAITATAVSTDTIDLSQARDVGVGEELKFALTIDQTFNNLTTLAPQVITSAAASASACAAAASAWDVASAAVCASCVASA